MPALVVERLARMVLPVRVRGEREHRLPVARSRRRPEASTPPVPLTSRGAAERQRLDRRPRPAARGRRRAARPCSTTTRCAAAANRRDDTIRNRYVVAHGALRVDPRRGSSASHPAAVAFDRRCRRCGDPAHGKPVVVSDALPEAYVQFSLSHSGSFAVVAVVTGARIGVDVESGASARARSTRSRRACSTRRITPTGSTCPTTEQLRRVPRAVDREGGVRQGDRRGHHVPLRDVPTDPDGWTSRSFESAAGRRVGARRGRGRTPVVRTTSVDAARGHANDVAGVGPRPIDKFRDTAVGYRVRGRPARFARRARSRRRRRRSRSCRTTRATRRSRIRSCCGSTPTIPRTRS